MILIFALACTPTVALNPIADTDDTGATSDGGSADGGGADGGTDTTEPDWSMYEGATLTVISPESGAFYPLGTPVPFEAVLIAADGSELPMDDIAWATNVDSAWAGSGGEFSDELTVGTHTITAQASLPNGDRLGWTVSGVLVQHEDAGTYVGDLSVDFVIEYEGTPITTTCFGAATLYVDAWGEVATGDSGCTLSLLGYELASTYAFDLAVDEGEVEGSAALDLVLWESNFDAVGTVQDGELLAEWESSLLGYIDFAGELDLVRISRETEADG